MLGIVDIFAQSTIQAHYQIDRPPYFIEFYLHSSAKDRKIMSNLLLLLMTELELLGIAEIGAVINDQNQAAQRVLLKAGFRYCSRFDLIQGYYQYDQYSSVPKFCRVG